MTHSAYDGLLVIDKPTGMTSRDVVDRAKGWFPRHTRIGHTGTLDPLATGVLVICVGLATRLAEYVQDMPKLYEAHVQLGATSDTDDQDGEITPTPAAKIPTLEEIIAVFGGFVGAIEQTPPDYSAARIAGRRAYDLARQGKEVVLTPRTVQVYAIDVLTYAYPVLTLQVRCGKGTYIRSLARDAGQRLGCGGYLTALRRLEVGCFRAANAGSLEMTVEEARQGLLPLAAAVHDLPKLTLPREEVKRLLHGRSIPLPANWSAETPEAALCDEAGRLLAVVQIAEGMLRPHKGMLRGEEF